MRSDEVLAAWDYIDPVIEKVRKKSPELYSADSMGPEDKILIKKEDIGLTQYWNKRMVLRAQSIAHRLAKLCNLRYQSMVCIFGSAVAQAQ